MDFVDHSGALYGRMSFLFGNRWISASSLSKKYHSISALSTSQLLLDVGQTENRAGKWVPVDNVLDRIPAEKRAEAKGAFQVERAKMMAFQLSSHSPLAGFIYPRRKCWRFSARIAHCSAASPCTPRPPANFFFV